MVSAAPDRQSFLGPRLEEALRSATVGVVGLSGGGSHVVQQLAHIGFRRYLLYDPDVIEMVNLHRLVGGTVDDVKAGRAKVEIARRVILSVRPDARVTAEQRLWQADPEPLRGCDVVFGCVDTFRARSELETACRRYLIPYIDIGMDVTPAEGEPPRMAGQVILSLPGGPCMRCLGFLRDELLAKEAARYGAAGGRPQVVWANGVLASAAVGVALDLLTAWSGAARPARFLSYDGNLGTVGPDPRLRYLPEFPCPHFPSAEVGDPAGVLL